MPDMKARIKFRMGWLAERAGWLADVDQRLVDLFLSRGHEAHALKDESHGVGRARPIHHLRFHLANAQPLLKRLLDLVLASVMLVLLLPLIIVTAILVKLTSPGPVFFAEKRVGISGKPLLLYKFRTTRGSGETGSGTARPLPPNPDSNKLGAFLRKTKLDGLPLFLSIVKGDMSLVGPRPEELRLLRFYLGSQDWAYAYRHIKPGIIGWSQVAALVHEASSAHHVEANLYYIQNWSLALDLRILWHAPRAWLRGIRDRLASR